ncbi:MAG: RNA methyltransferase [Clostridia bacterium]|nr:RNA methyltransferase [Clostridia bacterium]
MEIITSKNNAAVVAAAKLSDKKYRERTKTFAFEGIKLFSEALSAGICFSRVFVTEAAYEKYREMLCALPDGILTLVSEAVYEKLSFESAPQGVFSVAEYFSPKIKENASFVLLLDGVADPGNFGAILRSAEAFGVDAVYMGKNGADLYNPKTVRACMGSLFRTDVRRTENIKEEIILLQKSGFRIFATALNRDSKDIRDVNFSGKIGFVIGNEGHGVSEEALSVCDGSVIIPMREGPESLNAAVASSVVMWEAARQRL